MGKQTMRYALLLQETDKNLADLILRTSVSWLRVTYNQQLGLLSFEPTEPSQTREAISACKIQNCTHGSLIQLDFLLREVGHKLKWVHGDQNRANVSLKGKFETDL